MTTTYRISIDDRSGATLRGRVHIVNPDAERVPPGRDFALRLIVEVWHRVREDYLFTSSGENLPDDRVHRDPTELRAVTEGSELREEFERLWALDHGAEVRLSDEQVAEIEACREIRDHGQRESARHALKARYGVESLSVSFDGTPHLRTTRDGHAFHDRAGGIVTDYTLGEMRNWPPPWDFGDDVDPDDFDEDEYSDRLDRMALEDYPYTEFRITVKDDRYLDHLGGGIHLATTLFGEFGR
ncbi:hypothetical protein [Saccharothrix sp. NRRL B-16314]|uniref:hypothetical protein n=1 Tax=Saccharothrix sp. NRRL B-16314 TaxID=1463825 RepID=UPI0005279824|nr:hypothetical protein [Saccharothrix sp. NRRL B-16314]